jgi:hypothetical protein
MIYIITPFHGRGDLPAHFFFKPFPAFKKSGYRDIAPEYDVFSKALL